MRYPLKHIVEYLFLRLIALFVCILPYRAALAFGWVCAFIAHYLFQFRRSEAIRRIKEIFGEKVSNKKAKQIAWRSFRNFIFTGIEMIRIPHLSQKEVSPLVEFVPGLEKLKNQIQTGKGAIIATIHMGSWELASLTCLYHGIPLFSLVAPQKNKLVDNFLNKSRAGTGFDVLLRNNSVLKNIIRRIREGKVLAILPDLRAKQEAIGVQFLGKTASVSAGAAYIAKHTEVPIFPVIITRIGWIKHRYEIFDPIFPDKTKTKEDDVKTMMQGLFDIFSNAILNQPEQWFWYNKRWIFDPY
jgi:KDO2-lipid IV(A) lauroyltransferase